MAASSMPRVALGGAEARPRRLAAVEALLQGAARGAAQPPRAARMRRRTCIEAMEDGQVPASLRRDMVRVTTRRALLRAFA